MTHKLRFILTLVLPLHACGGRDDPANGTMTAAETSSSSSAAPDPTGGGSSNGSASTTTTAPESSTTDGSSEDGSSEGGSSEGGSCDCRIGDDCPGTQVCVACECVGGDPVCPSGYHAPEMACDECLQTKCCGPLQACWGDGTETEETQCSLLNTCRVELCSTVLSGDLEACIDENCPEYAAAYPQLIAHFDCTVDMCGAECLGN